MMIFKNLSFKKCSSENKMSPWFVATSCGIQKERMQHRHRTAQNKKQRPPCLPTLPKGIMGSSFLWSFSKFCTYICTQRHTPSPCKIHMHRSHVIRVLDLAHFTYCVSGILPCSLVLRTLLLYM